MLHTSLENQLHLRNKTVETYSLILPRLCFISPSINVEETQPRVVPWHSLELGKMKGPSPSVEIRILVHLQE